MQKMTPHCGCAVQGSSSSLLLTTGGVLVGAAAGLLLVPVFTVLFALALPIILLRGGPGVHAADGLVGEAGKADIRVRPAS